MQKIENILFPTDFSEHSRLSMEYAVTFAKKYGAKLYMLHVVEQVLDASEFYMPNFSINDLWRQMEESARNQMDKLSSELENKEIQIESILCHGTPFLEIIRTAREKNIDVIVIATHGRTGLEHVLFGSVAEKVVRKAPCSVFVAKKLGQKFVMP